jgi:hypothetical protein
MGPAPGGAMGGPMQGGGDPNDRFYKTKMCHKYVVLLPARPRFLSPSCCRCPADILAGTPAANKRCCPALRGASPLQQTLQQQPTVFLRTACGNTSGPSPDPLSGFLRPVSCSCCLQVGAGQLPLRPNLQVRARPERHAPARGRRWWWWRPPRQRLWQDHDPQRSCRRPWHDGHGRSYGDGSHGRCWWCHGWCWHGRRADGWRCRRHAAAPACWRRRWRRWWCRRRRQEPLAHAAV